MSAPEIINKLERFLLERKFLTQECEVVYFMVEVRKVLEQQNISLPVLKFYADWCVHSKKDRITPEIRAMSEEMYAGAVARINDPNSPEDHALPINDFVYMANLRTEVGTFLTQFNLPSDLSHVEEDWMYFIVTLTKVLVNQPINNPSVNVKRILFEPAADRCVIGVIEFNAPVKGNDYFRLMNAY